MQNIKRIFIVGHMGAGRTLLAEVLADELGWASLDLYIGGLERQMGRALSDIVGKPAEAVILQYQADLLAHYQKREKVIFSTDDTFILSPEIRKQLSSEYVIYLKVSTETQLERMSYSPLPPFPLLSAAEKTAFLDTLHRERDHLFEEVATFTIESKSVEEDIETIQKALRK